MTANASGSGEGFRRLRRPTLSRKYQAAGLTANRGQYETQKLLSHLLDRLEARPRAPDLLDRAALTARQANGLARKSKRGAAAFGEAVAAAAMGHKASSSVSSIPPEEDEEELNLLQEGVWNIDATFDMVEQMRNLLVLAEKQSLDLFGASQIAAAEAARAAATKGKGSRFSSSPLAKTTSNASDPFETVTVSGPELLKRMAETVRSLLTIDCLYKATKIRPMQPPYALQAVCLDIAAVLYHKGDLKIQLAMMEAVVDGLYSMGDVLREKVCEWLEGRLAEMLHKLAKERGEGSEEKLNVEWNGELAIVARCADKKTHSLSRHLPPCQHSHSHSTRATRPTPRTNRSANLGGCGSHLPPRRRLFLDRLELPSLTVFSPPTLRLEASLQLRFKSLQSCRTSSWP